MKGHMKDDSVVFRQGRDSGRNDHCSRMPINDTIHPRGSRIDVAVLSNWTYSTSEEWSKGNKPSLWEICSESRVVLEDQQADSSEQLAGLWINLPYSPASLVFYVSCHAT